MEGSSRRGSRLTRSARREAILDAAAEVVAERAVDAISMSDVVRVSGVSRPVVYDHFPTTRHLTIALIDRHGSAFEAALAEHRGANGPVVDEEGFRAVLAVIFGEVERDPAGWRLVSQDPSVDDETAAAQRRGRERVNRAIAAALDLPGPPRTTMLVAEAIRAGASGLHAWGQERSSVRRGQLIDAFVAVTWRGIGS